MSRLEKEKEKEDPSSYYSDYTLFRSSRKQLVINAQRTGPLLSSQFFSLVK